MECGCGVRWGGLFGGGVVGGGGGEWDELYPTEDAGEEDVRIVFANV